MHDFNEEDNNKALIMMKYLQESRTTFSKNLEAADTIDFQGGVMAGPVNKTKQTTMMAKKIDKHLEEKLFKHLDKLRKKIDWIGDKELRQKLDGHATAIHNIIKETVESQDKKSETTPKI